LGYLGFEGAGCVVQLRAWKSIYNITMWQAWVLTLICGHIGSLFLTALTMFISAKTRSSVIAVTTPFVILFLPSILQGMSDWLDMVLSLMPVNLLEFYQHLRTFQLITIFGRVYRVLDVCIPLYAVLTLVLVPIIYRQFRKN
ncbi:MAG: ABC transporter permease, partial [Lachnospiraceae bacterium]|nr:ABC transporter permease [Lachnospiraceae bacterium]